MDAPVTPVLSAVWSGGTADLYSAAFVGADTVPQVLLGPHALSAVRLDTFLVRVTLPDTTGVLDLTVHFADGRERPAGQVHAYGYSDSYLGPDMGGNAIPTADGTHILSNGDSGLFEFDPRTRTGIYALPLAKHDPTCALAPALSLVPGAVVGVGTGCRYRVYDLASPHNLIDTTFAAGQNHSAAYVGPGRIIVNTSCCTIGYNGASQTTLERLSETAQFIPSPAGNRLFPVDGSANVDAVPVYNPLTFTVAYMLPGVYDINGVAFSKTGDTAFIRAKTHSPPYYLFRLIEPNTGTTLAETALATGGGERHLVAEPDRPWLYLPGTCGTAPSVVACVTVVDRRSLQVVAVLRAPGSSVAVDFQLSLVPVLSLNERRLYLVNVRGWRPPFSAVASPVYVFDLLP